MDDRMLLSKYSCVSSNPPFRDTKYKSPPIMSCACNSIDDSIAKRVTHTM